MATARDPSKLMTIAQIAEVAAVKRRAVVDWIQKGWIKPVMKHNIPGKAGAATSLFDPAHVDDLLRRRAAAKSEVLAPGAPGPVVRASPMAVAPNMRTIDATTTDGAKHAPLRADVMAAAAAGRDVWMTIPEGSAHIGLPAAYLLRLVRDGELHAVKSGAWYVRRRDLASL